MIYVFIYKIYIEDHIRITGVPEIKNNSICLQIYLKLIKKKILLFRGMVYGSASGEKRCSVFSGSARRVDTADNNCLILPCFFQYISPIWDILGVMRAQNKLGSRTAGAMNVGLQSEKTNHK